MNTKRVIRKIGIVLFFGGGMFAWVGCEDVHQENLQLAEARWSRARASVQMQLAEQQYRNGQLDKSLVTIGQASALDPTFPRAALLRGQILAEKGQGQAAIAAFDVAISRDAKLAEAYYGRGVQRERWGQFDKALADYQLAHEAAPNNVCYTVAAAEALGHLNRTPEALALIDAALVNQEQSVSLRVTAGELCQASGDHKRAAKYFRDAARLATDDPTILRSLAMALYRAGQRDEARGYLEQVNARPAVEQPRAASAVPQMSSTAGPTDPAAVIDAPADGDRAEVLAALGDCYLTGGQADRARDCFVELTRLCPKRADGWESLAKVALTQDQWAAAIASADKAIALNAGSVGGHLVRGYALIQLGRPAEAVWAFQRAHKLAPRDVLMLCMLSESHRRAGDPAHARDALVRALQIVPDDPLARRMMNDLAGVETKAVPAPPTVTAGVKTTE